MARRSEHTQEQLREMVLQAAEAIIDKNGLQALKVRKIAIDIGYTVGSVYMVFDNLDDLIMHVKARTLDNLALHLDRALSDSDADTETAIRSLARAYLQFANRHYNLWSMIFTHRLPDNAKVPEWYQNRVDHLFMRIENLFHALSPQQTNREISQAARALWSGIHGICILSLSGPLDTVELEEVEASVLLLSDCFMQGWTLPENR